MTHATRPSGCLLSSILRIPRQAGQAFRRKADTDSDGIRTVIPIDPGQP
jgi:hypothetical protein